MVHENNYFSAPTWVLRTATGHAKLARQ